MPGGVAAAAGVVLAVLVGAAEMAEAVALGVGLMALLVVAAVGEAEAASLPSQLTEEEPSASNTTKIEAGRQNMSMHLSGARWMGHSRAQKKTPLQAA